MVFMSQRKISRAYCILRRNCQKLNWMLFPVATLLILVSFMASIMDVEMRSSIKKEARCTDWVTGRENKFAILLTDGKSEGLDFVHYLAALLLTEA